jgi:hypothetical protein
MPPGPPGRLSPAVLAGALLPSAPVVVSPWALRGWYSLNTGTANVTSFTVPLTGWAGANPQPGDAICLVACSEAASVTFAQSGGNFSFARPGTDGDVNGNFTTWAGYHVMAPGDTGPITFTTSASSAYIFFACAFIPPPGTQAIFDTQSAIFKNGAAATSFTPNAATGASPGGELSVLLAVGREAAQAPFAVTMAAPAGWTMVSIGGHTSADTAHRSNMAGAAYLAPTAAAAVTPGSMQIQADGNNTNCNIYHFLFLAAAGGAPSAAPVLPPGMQSPMALGRAARYGSPAPPPPGGPPAPAYPLRQPVMAKPRALPARGRTAGRAGVYGQLGPPVTPLRAPVASQGRGLPPRGRTARLAGTYGQLGPPARQPRAPAAAVTRPLPARGRTAGRAGVYGQLGPPVTPLRAPVTAVRPGPYRPGRTARTAGAYGQLGPPVRSPHGPVRSLVPAGTRGGSAARRAGALVLAGPVTAAARSTSTVTDPRDGTKTVTAQDTSAATVKAAAVTAAAVTDPRDGTKSVTAQDTSTSGVS